MKLVDSGKAVLVRTMAQRFGCTDPDMLSLIEKLAASDIVVGKPKLCRQTELNPDFYELTGTMDGKDFRLVLTGPAVEDFA